jgi:hypothetical protein
MRRAARRHDSKAVERRRARSDVAAMVWKKDVALGYRWVSLDAIVLRGAEPY